jgi:hypothetical protein
MHHKPLRHIILMTELAAEKTNFVWWMDVTLSPQKCQGCIVPRARRRASHATAEFKQAPPPPPKIFHWRARRAAVASGELSF